jgi:hypothetical protein
VKRPGPDCAGELALRTGGGVEQLYRVSPVVDRRPDEGGFVLLGWRLERLGKPGTVYHIDTNTGTADWLCDCPDCVYRQRACKHALGLREALLLPGRPEAPARKEYVPDWTERELPDPAC